MSILNRNADIDDGGLYPTEIISELIGVSKKYATVDNHDIAYDASMLLQSTPAVMSLLHVLASARPSSKSASKAATDRGIVMYMPDGRVKLTAYGEDEMTRIFVEFSKKIGTEIDRKVVDMNDPILTWSPPSGWGISEAENAALPPKRELRARLTYRQWLTMVYKDSKVWVTAQEGLMETREPKKDSPEWHKRDERVKSRHAQLRNVRALAKLVLSGGPDNVWIGKPLIPKDVHNDVEAFYAAGKPGFTSKITEASSLAWELWETDTVSLGEYAEVREWCDLENRQTWSFGEKALEKHPEGPDIDVDGRPVVYRRTAKRDAEKSVKMFETYDPTAVNHPMDFAASKMAVQIANPGSFGQIKSDGTMAHYRCDYVYGHDDVKDPGYVMHSRKGGTQCGNIAVAGTTRCEMHGGLLASPAETRAMILSSQLQAFALAGQAMTTIADIMLNGQTEAVRLRAAETILNRSGVIEGAEIDIRGEKKASTGSDTARDIVMDRLKRLAQFDTEDSDEGDEKDAESPSENDAKTVDGDYIEAEVVETDEKSST